MAVIALVTLLDMIRGYIESKDIWVCDSCMSEGNADDILGAYWNFFNEPFGNTCFPLTWPDDKPPKPHYVVRMGRLRGGFYV